MDFPASPTVDQNFAADVGNGSWTWTGKTWQRGFTSVPLTLASVIPNEQWANYDFNQGVTITGTGFWPTSEVLWDGVPAAAIFISDTEFRMIVNGITEPVPRDATVAVRHGSVTTPSHPYHFIPIPPTVPHVQSLVPDTANSFGIKTITMNGSNLLATASIETDHPTATVSGFTLGTDSTLSFSFDAAVFNLGYWRFTPKNSLGEGSGAAGVSITP